MMLYGRWPGLQNYWNGPLIEFITCVSVSKKDRSNAESSHTRWGLRKDYTRQVLPLQYNAVRLRQTQDLSAQVG
jgi:hypothetical protein